MEFTPREFFELGSASEAQTAALRDREPAREARQDDRDAPAADRDG